MGNAFVTAKYLKGRNIAWIVGGLVVVAFVGGVMVDVDHPLAQLLGIHRGRFLHPFFAFAGLAAVGIGLVLVITCIRRLRKPGFLAQDRNPEVDSKDGSA